jgi:hypothetical protein
MSVYCDICQCLIRGDETPVGSRLKDALHRVVEDRAILQLRRPELTEQRVPLTHGLTLHLRAAVEVECRRTDQHQQHSRDRVSRIQQGLRIGGALH